jgi:NACalpha-BTF3-like transcription factor
MRQVHLNHHLKLHAINIYAIGLLVMGIFCALAVFIYNQQLTNQSQVLLSKMQQQKEMATKSKIDARRVSSSSQIDKAKYEEITIVNHAIKQLVLPWIGLFKGLESINKEDIKLLVLEPNVQKETVIIKAIALDTNSMMSYIDELSQKKMLKKVTLLSQSNRELNGKAIIEFEVEALWKM